MSEISKPDELPTYAEIKQVLYNLSNEYSMTPSETRMFIKNFRAAYIPTRNLSKSTQQALDNCLTIRNQDLYK